MTGAASASALRDVVEKIAEATTRFRVVVPGFAYTSMYDFVAQHGVEYTEIGDRAKYPTGTPQACFGNSAVAALCFPGLRYVEGFAWNAYTVGFPVHHAWNLDDADRVVDTTWSNGLAYLGVVFPIGLVAEALEQGSSVLDDWRHDFPILREPWKGEN